MFGRKNKKEKKDNGQSGIIQIGALFLIIYVIASDIQNNRSTTENPPAKNNQTSLIPNQTSLTPKEPILPKNCQEEQNSETIVEDIIEQISISDIKAGEGVGIICGDKVKIHYKAVLPDGEVLADTEKEIIIGQTSFLDDLRVSGLEGMKVGGTRQIIIPDDMTNQDISQLGVVVDLLSIKDSPFTNSPLFKIFDESKGSGNIVYCGEEVSVSYKAYLPDGTTAKEGTLDFALGDENIPTAFNAGIYGMAKQGKRLLIASPTLLKGSKTGLPQDNILHIEVVLN